MDFAGKGRRSDFEAAYTFSYTHCWHGTSSARMMSAIMTAAVHQAWFSKVLDLGGFPPRIDADQADLCTSGEKGSAKTAAAKRVGTMLFGRNFDVASMTDDVKDFDAAIAATALLVADNTDTERKWLADKLATVATGGRVKKRFLYNTNTMTSIWSIAWVILTSRTPHFRRDDMARRLLLLRTRRLESVHSLAELDRRTVE